MQCSLNKISTVSIDYNTMGTFTLTRFAGLVTMGQRSVSTQKCILHLDTVLVSRM